jgi:hypothetical protein
MKAVMTLFRALLVLPLIVRGQDRTSEVENLMKDRPGMAVVIDKHPRIHEWLVRAFRGDFTSLKIRWQDDDTNLSSNSRGAHSYENGNAIISVSRKSCPTDQLTILVYECVNIGYESTYRSLFAAASARRIQREDFVARMMQTEHLALLETQQILRDNLPLTKEETSKTDFYRKVMGTPRNFARFIDYYERNKRRDFDLRNEYRSVYDSLSGMTAPVP